MNYYVPFNLRIQHLALVLGQRPNFTIADYSASADCKNCSFGHSLIVGTYNVLAYFKWLTLIYFQLTFNFGIVHYSVLYGFFFLPYTQDRAHHSIAVKILSKGLWKKNTTPTTYSKASRCTFFGEWKNSCSSNSCNFFYLIGWKARWSKNRAAQGFTT